MARDVRYWDRVSGRPMDFVERLSANHVYHDLIRTTLDLRPGDRALDLGCGNGRCLPVLREQVGPEGHVLGIDYSPKMVARATERAEQWDNVDVRQADATTVDLPDDHFDAVLASFSISATQDVPAVVDVVHRTLRPGGRLFAPDMHLVARDPVTWAFRLMYRGFARWTGVDVLATIRDRFGDAVPVNAAGRPVRALPRFTPVLMITARKDG